MKTYVDNFPPYSRNTSCDLRKKTNADRIRAMTDEELANELCFIADAFYYGRDLQDKLRLYPFKSYKEVMKWLRQPSEN